MEGDSIDAIVWAVDDDPAMRASLRDLLESVGLRVQIFATGEDFLSGYDPDVPGCIVLDLRMPGMSGLQLQEELNAKGVGAPVIMITGFADVPTAIHAMKNGAFDFLEKPFSVQLLLERVNAAIELDRRRREDRRKDLEMAERLRSLTRRERELVDLIADGVTMKVICTRLGLSLKTAEIHRRRALEKIGAKTIVEALRCVDAAARLPGKPTHR